MIINSINFNFRMIIMIITLSLIAIFAIIITYYFYKIENYMNYGKTCLDVISTITPSPSISSEINGDYEILKFIYDGSAEQTLYNLTFKTNILVDILIVGGGGGGGTGGYENGGGGGGGVLYMVNKVFQKDITYKIKVGDGGAYNQSGFNSSITLSDDTDIYYDDILLIGKGGGTRKTDGGSGGGGANRNGGSGRFNPGNPTQGLTFWNGTTYVPGGFSGGNGGSYNGGGGGGAGAVGERNGGDGREVNITGVSLYYGGGGGASSGGLGGLGGGGRTYGWYSHGQPGTPHTGGGGGAYYSGGGHKGGKGGSGIVIIRKKNILADTSSITNLGSDVVLWHDAKNIDGAYNSSLTNGDTVTTWYNLSNSGYTTSNGTTNAPTYNGTGLFFGGKNAYNSTVNLNNYSTMNIFVVWKPNALHSNFRWLWGQDDGGYDRTLIMYAGDSGTSHYVGKGDGGAEWSSYTFTANTTVIVNCEYNTSGQTGGFYINNSLNTSFTSLSPNGTNNTVFGARDPSGSQVFGPPHDSGITGDMYEIIIIDRLLTTTERTNIYNYLNTKWAD